MQTQDSAKAKRSNVAGFTMYAGQRLIVAIILIIAVVGGAAYLLNHFDIEPAAPLATSAHQSSESAPEPIARVEERQAADGHADEANDGASSIKSVHAPEQDLEKDATEPKVEDGSTTAAPMATTARPQPLTTVEDTPTAKLSPDTPVAGAEPPSGAATQETQSTAPQPKHTPSTPAIQPERHPESTPHTLPKEPHTPIQEKAHRPIGVAFVEAVIQPIDQELNQRFFGWRPNDIINLADNTKNYQLGVLEVTRRTTVHLAEHISRTGNTDAFNPHLENAMNLFMVKADQYWFPAPETKYKESLNALDAYKKELIDGTATLYTRTDNLIPLLMAYENLLGSCDENLVKHTEKDGSDVSLFKADDYYYYAKGVASAIAGILEAIHHDFAKTLESRNGSELLHHAAASCHAAAALSPLFITDSDLDGLFANHRANLAAPISHARFYLSQLIKTLTT